MNEQITHVTETVSTCRHCGQRIVRIEYATGAKWMHQPDTAAFGDDMEWYCRTSIASPVVP